MKKLVLILAVIMMAAPALADIVITIDNSVFPAEVKYNTTGGTTRVRAFALDIKIDAPNDVDTNIIGAGAGDVEADYWVHPGGIIIVAGDVNDEGNAWADPSYEGTEGGLDTNGVTIEMASLYKGAPNIPPDFGVLCTISVSGDCNVSISENAIRGGVINEDACSVSGDGDLDLSGAQGIPVSGAAPECYEGMPDYAEWDAAGKPDCWCYPRQCHGDADGHSEGSGPAGYAYVSPKDLSVLAGGWQIKDPTKGTGILGVTVTVDSVEVPVACADFDHAREGSGPGGYARVSPKDLAILATAWMVKEATKGVGIEPNCLPGNK